MPETQQKASISTKLLLYIGLLILVLFPLAGLGSRFGWWNFHTGLMLVRWDFYAAIVFGLISLLAVIIAFVGKRYHDRRPTLWAFIFCLIPASFIGYQAYLLKSLPWIHDVTTDTQNPPEFVVLLKQKTNGARTNSLVYEGIVVAKQQKAAYPDIKPIISDETPAQSFADAMRIAKRNHWDVVSSNPKTGTIEAVATTMLFGFKDDVVIRVKAQNGGSRVDLRSVSRVGESDFGVNAKRIQHFMDEFKRAQQHNKAMKNADT